MQLNTIQVDDMNIPYKFNPMGVSNASLNIENPLCINAATNLYVTINAVGNPDDPNILYSLDSGKSWSSYTLGTDINLDRNGATVLLYGQSGRWSTSGSNYLTIKISNAAALTGNLASLINYQQLNDSYTFYRLFQSSSSLNAGGLILPWGALTDFCFWGMFIRCNGLSWAPVLRANYLAKYCYGYMFSYCTNLRGVPDLNAMNLAEGCYDSMFKGCNITSNKLLSATKLPSFCYQEMFSECKNLTNVTDLPATSLSDGSYQYKGMFQGCTSLTTAPKINAAVLSSGCYSYMFKGCTSLTTAPQLPATTLKTNCYSQMFYNCSNLNYVKVKFTDWYENGSPTYNWLYGVAANGTFDAPAQLPVIFDASHIPVGWNLPNSNKVFITAESQTLNANINTQIDYQIQYTITPSNVQPTFTQSGGTLPNGLTLTESGKLIGSVNAEIKDTLQVKISAENADDVVIAISYHFIDATITNNDLTANDSNPEYSVSQRSTYGSDYAYYAMDGDDWTYSKTQYSSAYYDWWQIDFHSPTIVYSFDITVQNQRGKRMHLQASNDGETWQQLLTYLNGNSTYSMNTDNTTAYRYYRFVCEVKNYYIQIHQVYFTYKKMGTPDVNDVQSFKITSATNLNTSSDEYLFFVENGTNYTYNKVSENLFEQQEYSPITLSKRNNQWVFADSTMMNVELITDAENPFDPNATWYRLMDSQNNNIKLTFEILS